MMKNLIVRTTLLATIFASATTSLAATAETDYENNPLTTTDPVKTGIAVPPTGANPSSAGDTIINTDQKPTVAPLQINPQQLAELEQQKVKAESTWHKYYEMAVHAVENADIGFNILNDHQVILDFLNLQFRDHVEISPSYIGGYFTRYDAYNLTEDMRPFLWFLNAINPLLFSVAPQQELGVWRVYDSWKKASRGASHIPFVDLVVKYIPFNTDIILKRFEPGTQVRFRLPLNILAGLNYNPLIGTTAQIFTTDARLYSGDYDIYVFRGDGQKIRLRLVAKASREWLSVSHAGLTNAFIVASVPGALLAKIVFHIFKIDDVIGAQFDLAQHQDIFLADYTLDLSNEKVAKAYNKLFSEAMVFTDKGINWSMWAIVNPKKDRAAVQSMLVSDLTAIEDIYKEDMKIEDPSKRRVERNFVGNNGSDGYERQWHAGTDLIYKYKRDWSYRENTLIDDTDKPDLSDANDTSHTKYYIFPQWYDHRQRTKFVIDRLDILRSANIVYDAEVVNDVVEPKDFSIMGFYYDFTETRYDNGWHQQILTHFNNLLPDAVIADLHQWLVTNDLVKIKELLRGVRVSGRYFVNDQGLAAVVAKYKNLNQRQKIIAILKDIAPPMRSAKDVLTWRSAGSLKDRQLCQEAFSNVSAQTDRAMSYCGDLVKIANNFATVLTEDINPDKHKSGMIRKAAMSDMIHIKLFTELGPAFVFSLIPVEYQRAALRFELRFSLPGVKKALAYRWPRDENGKPVPLTQRKLLEQILDNEKTLNNDTPDLRLECQEETITCRDTRKHTGALSDPDVEAAPTDTP